ncbi:MAG: DegT/DnrJ/EryC1/StrS family aminotransferase [Planctomycetota bacterium]
MTNFLIGLEACYDAFVAAPVARALLDRGDAVQVAWFGSRAGFEQALTLGLPADLEAVLAGEPEDEVVFAAHEFAAANLDGGGESGAFDVVLTVGPGPFAAALAQAADSRGPRTVRLQAGERNEFGHEAGHLHNRARRLADHSAAAFCVRSEQQRLQLIQEGIDGDSIAVVGSLAADAGSRAAADADANPGVDRDGGTADKQPFVWLAIEHESSVASPRAVQDVAKAAAAHGLAVRAVPTQLQPQPWADSAWFVDEYATPLGQLRAACAARVVVTDSLGHRDLAASNGIACCMVGDARERLPVLLSSAAPAAGPAETDSTTATAAVLAHIDSLHARRAAAAGASAGASAADAPSPTRVAADLPAALPADLPADGNASGRTFDAAERVLVDDVLRTGTLNSTRGTYVHRFERAFANWLGRKHAIACNSGSAAVHCAIAALGLSAGDEVITTPITDMGALTPIFYEGAVPVFCDVDPDSLNVTAETIRAQLTERTRAIIVTHLFGRPAELDAIFAIACEHNLLVIEDAAQAFGASLHGKRIGTQSWISAFSLQQGKHITTGEGGIVCTDDDEVARRLFLFVNKAWGYGDAKPDHYFPALNYRMTELQGAVACGQLPKLDEVVHQRRRMAAELRHGLQDLAGVHCPDDPQGGVHSYWKFAFRVDADVVPGGAVALGGRMREQGIACAPRYVQKPAFECQLFRQWSLHPVSALPLGQNPRGADPKATLFARADYPGSIAGLEQVVVLPINERYRSHHITDTIVPAIRAAHQELTN